MKKNNKTEDLIALSLMCSALIKCIELYKVGIEPYDSIITRAKWLSTYIANIGG